LAQWQYQVTTTVDGGQGTVSAAGSAAQSTQSAATTKERLALSSRLSVPAERFFTASMRLIAARSVGA
jgi:hypothetical protein